MTANIYHPFRKPNRLEFMKAISRMFVVGIQRFSLTLFLSLCLAATAVAQERYIPVGTPDGIALLPPPPVFGSAEAAADLACARAVFKARTSTEEARALKDGNLSIFNFSPAIGSFFEAGKFPKTEALFAKVKKEIKETIDLPKDHWKRQRPYEVDKDLDFGKPEKSRTSYPSGHSTMGTVHALLLAELFPEKRDAILAIGRNIGWDRVLIGKHFPTDVQAGRVLGQAIVHELLGNPSFQKDLAEAREEVKAVQR
jgi:acid phosphatase (class A)